MSLLCCDRESPCLRALTSLFANARKSHVASHEGLGSGLIASEKSPSSRRFPVLSFQQGLGVGDAFARVCPPPPGKPGLHRSPAPVAEPPGKFGHVARGLEQVRRPLARVCIRPEAVETDLDRAPGRHSIVTGVLTFLHRNESLDNPGRSRAVSRSAATCSLSARASLSLLPQVL